MRTDRHSIRVSLHNRIDQPRMIRALRSYFASGWAFLIPYLAVYLLYYATDWRVNPSGTDR